MCDRTLYVVGFKTLSGSLGTVFEKRLIEAYIAENGSEPVTGEALTIEDLVDLKTARIVRPRPPTLTSIPSLLTVFQNEWDALALETFTLRQQLAQTRQELSTALYQHDAAVRVIARLTKERDEARDALSKIAVNTGRTGNNGDAMQIDHQELPPAIASKVDATQERYVGQCSSNTGSVADCFADCPKLAANVQCQKTGQMPNPFSPSALSIPQSLYILAGNPSHWTRPVTWPWWEALVVSPVSTRYRSGKFCMR